MAGRRKLQFKSLWDPIQLLQAFAEQGIRPQHAQKIWSFLIKHPSAHWSDVPDLPKAAVHLLDEQFSKFTTKVVDCQTSEDGETSKLLLELQDGLQVEAVIMHYDTTGRFAQEDGSDEPPCSSAASCADSVATGATLGSRGHRRATLCVSSQVGCQMGCTFCATGTMGLKGNLTAGEIVEQLVHANAISKIRNIVFMGMGEPLNNYEAVRAAIASMIDPRQWGLARQRVTVSTVGVVNRVKQLGEDLPGVGLALSLHAPNQDLRIQIVPSAKAYHIDKLIQSVADYQHLSKQRIFVEYVLLAGVNDGIDYAHQLGALLSGLKVLLNLIPWNPVLAAKEAHDYSAPSQESIAQFQSIVRTQYHVPTTVRQEKGQDISGACGQLALEKAAITRQQAGGAAASPSKYSAATQQPQSNSDCCGASVAETATNGIGATSSCRADSSEARKGEDGKQGGRLGLLGGVVGGIGGLIWGLFGRGGSKALSTNVAGGKSDVYQGHGERDRGSGNSGHDAPRCNNCEGSDIGQEGCTSNTNKGFGSRNSKGEGSSGLLASSRGRLERPQDAGEAQSCCGHAEEGKGCCVADQRYIDGVGCNSSTEARQEGSTGGANVEGSTGEEGRQAGNAGGKCSKDESGTVRTGEEMHAELRDIEELH